MFIKHANEPELEELVDIYVAELLAAGKTEKETNTIIGEVAKVLKSKNGLETFVVIESGHIASVCHCNIITMLPMPGISTKYYLISDVYTLERFRKTNFESLLLKYVECEMERNKIKKYEF